MAASEFKVGDRVKLRSGSPIMTVSQILPTTTDSKEDEVELTYWDDTERKFQTFKIAESLLVEVDKSGYPIYK